MKEEILSLCTNARLKMDTLENYVFENFRNRYSQLKTQINEVKEHIDTIQELCERDVLNDEGCTIAKQDIEKVLSILTSIESTYAKKEENVIDVVAPILETPDVTTPQESLEEDNQNEEIAPAFNNAEIDALIQALNESHFETEYPTNDVITPDEIDQVTNGWGDIEESLEENVVPEVTDNIQTEESTIDSPQELPIIEEQPIQYQQEEQIIQEPIAEELPIEEDNFPDFDIFGDLETEPANNVAEPVQTNTELTNDDFDNQELDIAAIDAFLNDLDSDSTTGDAFRV